MGSYAVSKAAAEAVARGFAVDVEQAVGIADPGSAATELDADELDGERVTVTRWRQATR